MAGGGGVAGGQAHDAVPVPPSPASGANPEEVQVYDTDYNVFALMLFRRQSGGQSILRVNLLCEFPTRLPLSSWWEQEGEGGQGTQHPHSPSGAKGHALLLGPQAGCG